MKLHRYRILLCAACCFALALVAAAPGSAVGAPIAINNITDLQKIGNDPAFPLDGDYELGQDIDASDTRTWNSGAGFIPIGNDNSSSTPFTGTFDGKGYAIRQLYINLPSTDYVGLFGYADGATLQNINFDNATVTGYDEVGGLVGEIDYGTISGCSITGRVSSADGSYDNNVGGLIGYISYGSIVNCSSAARVTGDYDYVGGLVGYDEYANIDSCSATGAVNGYYDYVGGLAAYVESGDITNCFSTAAVTGGSEYVGGLVGYSYYNAIDTSYATGPVAGYDYYVGGLVGYADTCAITNSYATGSVVGYDDSVGGLIGELDYGTISNCYATGSVSGGSDYTGGLAGYFEYGTIANCFATGAVNGYEEQVGGLVGEIYYGSIDACHATGAVNGYEYVGGLVGENYYGPITNSYATGAVSSNYEEAGGLVGYSYVGNITNCFATGPVAGSEEYAGGLVGDFEYGSMSNCYSTGTVQGYEYVGGLVGYTDYATISSSYATGAVNGYYDEIGGLVGYNEESSITMSYATGAVNAGDEYAGGLVGYNTSSYISNCYATGSVNTPYYSGGLVGYNTSSYIGYSYSTGKVSGSGDDDEGGLVAYNGGTVSACFWDKQTSGLEASDGGEAKTTAEMKAKATFTDAGWDFAAIWDITEGTTYPVFIAADVVNPPVASPDTYTTEPDTPLTVAAPGVLANDNTTSSAALTAVLVSGTAHGSVALNTDGSFVYVPDKRFKGVDTFIYKATDGTLDSASTAVAITVGRKKLCPAVKLYGEKSSQVQLLRKFRDRVLEKTATGSLAVDLYYRLAPAVDAMLDNSPYLSRKATQLIDLLLPALQRSMKR